MFGSKRIKSSKIDTLIGQGIEVTGDVKFTGGLHLEGTVKGNVTTADTSEGTVLIVSESGRVEGDVHVAYAVISGEVNGNVYASVKLELSKSARISGDVKYDLLAMASGAEINGKMLHNVNSNKIPARKAASASEVASEKIHNIKDTVAVSQ